MGDFFLDVFGWIETLAPVWVYLAVFLISYGENIVPPVPGDMVVVLGGYLAGSGTVSLPAVIALSTVGGTLGFMTVYAFGTAIGDAVMDPDRLRWIPKRRVRTARDWLQRWGYGVIAANRFLSGLRSVISLTVGMAHMNVWRTILLSGVSSLLWTSLIAIVGYKVGENWSIVSIWIRQYGKAIGILIIVFVLVQVIRYFVLMNKDRDEAVNGAANP